MTSGFGSAYADFLGAVCDTINFFGTVGSNFLVEQGDTILVNLGSRVIRFRYNFLLRRIKAE